MIRYLNIELVEVRKRVLRRQVARQDKFLWATPFGTYGLSKPRSEVSRSKIANSREIIDPEHNTHIRAQKPRLFGG